MQKDKLLSADESTALTNKMVSTQIKFLHETIKEFLGFPDELPNLSEEIQQQKSTILLHFILGTALNNIKFIIEMTSLDEHATQHLLFEFNRRLLGMYDKMFNEENEEKEKCH